MELDSFCAQSSTNRGTPVVCDEPTRKAKLPHFHRSHLLQQFVVCGLLSLDHLPRRFRVVTQLLQQ